MAEPFRWTHVNDRDELEAFYRSRLPMIKAIARFHGFAVAVHGSLRRDLDLIAVPWRDNHADKDTLAGAIQTAACGIENQSFQWEKKPQGRLAVSFPVCFPEWNEPNVGHVDLSVVGCL